MDWREKEKLTNLQDGVYKWGGNFSYVMHENPFIDPRCDLKSPATTSNNLKEKCYQDHSKDQHSMGGEHLSMQISAINKGKGNLMD